MKRFVLLTAMLSLTMTCFAQFPDRDTLGRSDKFRILVDKVISPPNKWKFTPAMMQEIKDAGFNVVSPRIGGHDLAVCREQTKMAYDAGLYYMAWMRGTLTAKQDVKMVWEDGAEQNLCSPNSDEFWEWAHRSSSRARRISMEIPTFISSPGLQSALLIAAEIAMGCPMTWPWQSLGSPGPCHPGAAACRTPPLAGEEQA